MHCAYGCAFCGAACFGGVFFSDAACFGGGATGFGFVGLRGHGVLLGCLLFSSCMDTV
jgi:hypothetical protein